MSAPVPIFTVTEMAKRRRISKDALYREIRAGRLHAKLRRGTTKPYYLTDEIFDEWWNHSLIEVTEEQIE